jgi:hypothetical protein
MDALNTVATAATKAVFGGAEANKEPVSGAQGDVGKGEPYDAGNLGQLPVRLSRSNLLTLRRQPEPGEAREDSKRR